MVSYLTLCILVTPKGVIWQKQSSKTEIQFYLEIISCDRSINTMDHSKYILSNQKEESIST